MDIPDTGIAILVLLISVFVLALIVVMMGNIGIKIQLVPQKKINLMMMVSFLAGLSILALGYLFTLTSEDTIILTLSFTVLGYNERTWGIVLILALVISLGLITGIRAVLFKRLNIEEKNQIESSEKGQSLLRIDGLKVYYPIYKGILRRRVGWVKAVNGVSFEIKTGETLGLVGESGCGKSTIAKHILGLVPRKEGSVIFDNSEVPETYPNSLRKQIQIVFQDPDASLNPRMKIVDIIAEPLRNLFGITNSDTLREKVMDLLEKVSLKREHLDRFPHEFSGGQKQRVVIARALACNPKLIILDEPTSALDVSVQAQILNLLNDLQMEYGYGFLFITHNLTVVHHVADKVAVMYLGNLVEFGTTQEIFHNPLNPYTKALLSARADIDPEHSIKRIILKGEVPSPINPPSGCAFHPRCYSQKKSGVCMEKDPIPIEVNKDHKVWCHTIE